MSNNKGKNSDNESPSTSPTISAFIGGALAATTIGIGSFMLIRRRNLTPGNSFLSSIFQPNQASHQPSAADIALQQQKYQQQSEEKIRNIIDSLRRDINSSASDVESRLGNKLQNQERFLDQRMRSHNLELNTRLNVVNSTQTELSSIARKMDDLREVFISPKMRGTFGEMQLEAIVQDVMHPGSYSFQKTLSTGKRPDCILKLPQPIGNLIVDSKFPMDAFLELKNNEGSGENSEKSVDSSSEKNTKSTQKKNEEMQQSSNAATRKKLSDNLRKHIRDIAKKYIIPGETSESAIMFVPSETIFTEIITHHPIVVEEAHQSRVWICGPTTFMAMLTTMRSVVRGITVSERTDDIMKEVNSLMVDVNRLLDRGDKLEKNVEACRENLRLMRVSMDKIQKKKRKLDMVNEMDFDVDDEIDNGEKRNGDDGGKE